MEFFDVVKNRHSIRAFKEQDIKEETLQKVIEAINLAPSAGNLQAYEIVVVKDNKQRGKLTAAALDQEFILEAPVVLVFCANPDRSSKKYDERGANLYCIQDATIAASYAQLAATALGLASVWVGAFDPEEVSDIVSAKNVLPVALIPIGYPDEEPTPKTRRELSDIVHQEKL